MAVAVKQTPETSPHSLFDRLPVASLVGMIYVLASFAAVLRGLPYVWYDVLGPALGFWRGMFVPAVLLGALMLAAVVGLVVLGARLLGPHPAPGLKAGVAVGLGGLFVIGIVTRWVGLLFESGTYDKHWFGSGGPMTGAVITGVVGVLLLGFAVRTFLQPGFQQWLTAVEAQGWFTSSAYKRLQGQRVRRGTMLGIIVLVGCGIWLIGNRLSAGSTDWQLDIPFTAEVTVDTVGDTAGLAKGEVVDRYALRDANEQLDNLVKVVDPKDSKDPEFDAGKLVTKQKLADLEASLKGENLEPPTVAPPTPASGTTTYQSLTILPDVRITLPLLLAAAALWLSWRFVNMPSFADFLIATEAELNKVSWTTRRRLVQDTMVVLVTVVLFTLFLLVVDLMWGYLLKSPLIRVLQVDNKQTEQQSGSMEQPW